MDIRLKCEKPGSIEYTIVATMMADDWEKIRDYLDKGEAPYGFGAAATFRNAITSVLAQARKVYWAEEEKI